jgi:hypothetical protein
VEAGLRRMPWRRGCGGGVVACGGRAVARDDRRLGEEAQGAAAEERAREEES